MRLTGRVCELFQAFGRRAGGRRQGCGFAFGQVSGQRLGNLFGIRPRQVANQRHAGVGSSVVTLMEGDDIGALDGGDGVRFCLAAVGVIRIQRRPEGLAGDAVRPRHRFLEGGDGPGLLAVEDRGIKTRAGDHQLEDIQCRVAFVAGRQRAQRNAGAVGVGAAGEIGAKVGELFGNLRLVTLAGAEVEDAAGDGGQPRLPGGVEGRAGGEVDLDVQHRQDAAFDEIDAGAG